MSSRISGLFTQSDRTQMASLGHRMRRSDIINSNIANSETPGYRAVGYDFENQLQDLVDTSSQKRLRTSSPRHMLNEFATSDGGVNPDVYMRPTESVGEDGNTVDVDLEMADLAKNQIQYRSAIESINRKIAILKYAIQGG
jgi:flagellar basal-body rod protein FlgB